MWTETCPRCERPFRAKDPIHALLMVLLHKWGCRLRQGREQL